VHNISTFMPIQTGYKPPILCTTSQRSCLIRTATNHQYCAQHLNVHAYSDRRHERWNVVHSIGGLLPVWIGMNVEMLCRVLVVRCRSAQHLNVHAYSDRQQTTNTVHNISMFMPIQTGNKPPILCTTFQRSCLFRTATNHQYHAQHLNVRCCAQYWWFVAGLNKHEHWDVVHGIGGLLPFWIGMNIEMLCMVLVVCCHSE
jgi:competence transcription factor ComK